MNTEQFWKEEFGAEYHRRNRVDWRGRVPFWSDVINRTGARSVFELGCGPGWNLSAIKRAYPDVMVYGADINEIALAQAEMAGLEIAHAEEFYKEHESSVFDLTMTVGMLIHVAPDDLERTMAGLVRLSAQYVLSVEYESEQEEEVEYRGHSGKLWRRPFGTIYQYTHGLRLIDQWDAGMAFDRCTATLLERT